jgi:hypothetical protein
MASKSCPYRVREIAICFNNVHQKSSQTNDYNSHRLYLHSEDII